MTRKEHLRWPFPGWAPRNRSSVHLCGSNLNSQSRFGIESMIRPIPSTGIDPSMYHSAQTSQNGSLENSRSRSLAVHRNRRKHKNSMKGPDIKALRSGSPKHHPLHQIEEPEVSNLQAYRISPEVHTKGTSPIQAPFVNWMIPKEIRCPKGHQVEA